MCKGTQWIASSHSLLATSRYWVRTERVTIFFDRLRRTPPWILLTLLLIIHGLGNLLYVSLSSPAHLMSTRLFHNHNADCFLVFGYRVLAGFDYPERCCWFGASDPPYRLTDQELDLVYKCPFPSMGEAPESGPAFSWRRAARLVGRWKNDKDERNPFFLIPAAVACLVAGPSVAAVMFSPTLYLLILLLFAYLCGKELKGPAAGLWAALFLGLMPWVFGLARYGRPYICLIAACAVSYYLLIRTRHFSRPVATLLFAASFPLGFHVAPTETEGILFFIIMGGPLLVNAWKAVAEKEDRARRALIVCSVLLVLGYYVSRLNLIDYFFHDYRKIVIGNILLDGGWPFRDAAVIEPDTARETGIVADWGGDIFKNPSALWAYPAHLLRSQISFVLLLGCIWPMARFIKSRRGHADLIFMFLIPFLILTVVNRKQPVYVTYLCFPIALMAGLGAADIRSRRWAVLVLASLAAACLQWTAITFEDALGPGHPAVGVFKEKIWKDDARFWRPYLRRSFYNRESIFPDGRLKEDGRLDLYDRMSRTDGLRVALVVAATKETIDRYDVLLKGAALLSINPTIEVHLVGGLEPFDVILGDLDWVVCKVFDMERFRSLLDSGERTDYLPAPDSEAAGCGEPGESARNLNRFMNELKEQAELRHVAGDHFFFSVSRE